MTQTETAEDRSGRRRSRMLRGAVTLLVSSLSRQGLSLLTLVVTTRLLAPADFGLAAYVMIAAILLEMVQRQITLPLVRMETVTRAHLDTLFVFQLGMAVAMAALCALAAAPLAALTGQGRIETVMLFIALVALVAAVRSPSFMLFDRKLSFNPAATEMLLGQLAYSLAAIGLALLWGNYWALLLGVMIQMIVRNVFTFVAAPVLPRLSVAKWRDTLAFSGWSMGAQLSQFFAQRLPQLVIGAALGLAEAGYFRIGERVTTLVTMQLANPITRVVFPGLADLSRDSGKYQEAFLRLNAMLLAVMLPLGVGAALLASDVIRVALGEEWMAAAPVIMLLAPLRAIETLQANVRAASLVEGRPRLLFVRNAILLAIVSLLMAVGVQYGFTGAIAAATGASLAGIVMTLLIAQHYNSGTFLAPLLVGWRSFLSCGAMAATVLSVPLVLDPGLTVAGVPLTLPAKLLVGMVTYPAAHFLFWFLAGRPQGIETLALQLLPGRGARKTPSQEV